MYAKVEPGRNCWNRRVDSWTASALKSKPPSESDTFRHRYIGNICRRYLDRGAKMPWYRTWFALGGGIDTQTAGLFQGLFALGNMVLFVIASYFLLVQMLHALGRSMSAGARFWSFVGMSILAGIGVGIGFMLLFIPGIIVMVRWSAANGYLLSGEHSITDSLGASWEATKGHGWSIFGAGLLLWIGLTVLNSVILGVVMGTGISRNWFVNN